MNTEDTVPIPVVDDAPECASRIPEPAMVRAGLFAAANLVAAIVGRQVLPPDVLEQIMVLYGVIGPMALGWWIRRHVTPAKLSVPGRASFADRVTPANVKR